MKYIIEDWAGNKLTLEGSPAEFSSFDDAWDYIYQVFDDDDFDDLYVVEKK